MAWTQETIRAKVRLLLARPSADDISDDDIDTAVNDFYQQDFISMLDLEELDDWWEVQTTANDEDIADVDTNFSVVGPVYLNGVQLPIYRDPETFFQCYSQDYDIYSVGTGDGAGSAFSFTLPKTPVSPRNIVIDDQFETFTVSSATSTVATLTGSLGGTGSVTLATGAGSVTFNSAPADQQDIRATYEFFSTGRPAAVLYFEDRLTFRPVPDQVYNVRARISAVPTALSSSQGLVFNNWGKALAYGASIELANDNGQQELAALLEPGLRRQLANIRQRAIRNLVNVRAVGSI